MIRPTWRRSHVAKPRRAGDRRERARVLEARIRAERALVLPDLEPAAVMGR